MLVVEPASVRRARGHALLRGRILLRIRAALLLQLRRRRVGR
jgi:hypothetical protein